MYTYIARLVRIISLRQLQKKENAFVCQFQNISISVETHITNKKK